MKKFFLFFLILSAGTCLHAQQGAPRPAASVSPATAASSPAPVLPPGPLLKPVADNTRWTLTTTYKHPGGPAPGTSPDPGADPAKPGEKEKAKDPTVTIMGERIGKTAHVLTVKASGREEQWTDGTLLAVMHMGANAPVFTTEKIENMPTPGWISRESFSDLKTQGEKSYLIFKARILPSDMEIVRDLEAEALGHAQDTEKLKVDALAVIDGDTRWPVVVKEGETSTTYKFEPLSPDIQIIPSDVQAALADREKKLHDLMRKPARP